MESEIEITPTMLEAGIRAFRAHDERFEPVEVAIIKMMRAILEARHPETLVVLAPEVESALSPYLG